MKKLTFKSISIICSFIFFNPTSIYSQFCGNIEDKKPSYYDSLGLIRKLRILDRFGNEYSSNEVSVQGVYDKLASLYPAPFGGDSTGYTPFVPSYTCMAGLFKVHFAGDTAGFGFHIPKNREIVCQVFRDLSRLIKDVNPSNAGRVNIWVSSDVTYYKVRGGSSSSSNSIAFASPFIVSPDLSNNFFSESLVARTIRLGYDSRKEYPQTFLGSEFMHGNLVIKFGQYSFDTSYRDTITPNSSYDLYSVALHEVIHLLGVYSFIAPNGISIFGNNVYSMLDKNLSFGNDSSKKVLKIDGNFNINFNSIYPNTHRGCSDVSTIKFFSKNLKGKHMYNPTNPSTSSLSHIGCSEGTSCSSFNNTLSSDVMNYCSDPGKAFIKRRPSIDEVKLLCDLGYDLNSINGVIAYGADTTNSTTYKIYNNPCNSYCNIIGGYDTFNFESDKNAITISIAQLLVNDKNAVSIRDFKAVGSNGSVIKYFNDSFIIYAEGNHSSEYLIFSYIPFCSDTTIMGTKTFVFVKLSVNTQPLCKEGDDCNMICKGDFEGLLNIRRLNYPEKVKYYGVNTIPTLTTDLFYRNCFDNTKLCQRYVGTNCTGDTNCGFPVTNYKLPPNNGKQFAGTRHTNSTGTYDLELFNFYLKKPLMPGKQYLMKYKVRRSTTHLSALDFKVLVAGDSVKPCLSSFTNLTGGISDCGFIANRIDRRNFLVKKNDTNWITLQDTLAPVNHKIQHIIIVGDTFIKSSNSSNFTGLDFAYLYWDDFEIQEINNSRVSLRTTPSTLSPCVNSQTHSISYRICADSADILDTLKLTVNLPSEMVIQSNSDFQLNQTLKVPKDSLKKGMCIERKLIYQLNPSITIPNQDLKVKLNIINSSTCYTTNEESVVTIKPIVSPITIVKSANKQNPNLYDTITYTITVCNTGADSISNIQFRDTIKPQLWVIDKGNFTQTGNILIRTYNIAKSFSIISPQCITDNYKAILENICPFENCAYVQHPSITCINTKSCISMNSSRRDSIKIVANKPRLCLGDTVVLRVQNWKQYGDYSWWDLNGASYTITSDSTIKITNGGNYRLKFERQFGCTLYDSITIPVDTPPTITKSITPAFCDNTNGAINITVSGGKSPYTYLWENASTSKDRTGLTEGRYILRVKDSWICSQIDTCHVSRQSSGIVINSTVVMQPSCVTSSNGSINISATNGVPPYSFLWSTGHTSQNRTGLSAGQYWVRVSDSRNCFDSVKINLTSTSNLKVKIDTNLSCERNYFILTAQPLGGVSPYSYHWHSGNNPNMGHNYTATINANYMLNFWHRIKVSDALGCIDRDSFYGEKPDSIIFVQWQSSANISDYIGANKPFASNIIEDKVIVNISNAVLNVDTPFTFSRCVIIPILDELNIESNTKLTLHDCRIRTCAEPGWKGFRMRDGAEIELIRDTIEDAYVGINVEGSATLGVQHTVFKNNGIGIYFKPFNLSLTSKSVKYSLPFIGNKFIGISGMMKSFANMEDIGGTYIKMSQQDRIAHPIILMGSSFYNIALSGFSNQSKPLAGIVMFNTENLMHGLGTKVSDRIYFDNLQYGFVAQDVRDVFLNNVSIKNISKIAILSELSNIYTLNNFIPSYFIPGLFGTNVANTTITNADVGISNHNTSIGLYNSSITGVTRGLSSRLEYSNAIGVENSSISASLKGIYSVHMGLIPSYNFKKNVIVINGSSYQADGLSVHSVVRPGARVFSPMEENTVELRGKANFAFSINSVQGNNYLIKNNTAKMLAYAPNTSDTSYYKGGFLIGNSQVDAIANTAYSYNRLALNRDFLPAHYPIGMSYIATDGMVACNNINNIRTGTLFSAGCKGAKFRRNKFNNHFTGLKIDNFSRLDTQINAGNTWIGSYTGGNPVLNMQTPSLTFFMANPSSPSRFRPTNTVPSGFIVLNSGNDNDACTGDWKNLPYMVSVFGGVQSGDVQIMQGSISYNAFNSFLMHQDEQQLYAELKPYEYEFADSSLEKLFIQSMEASGAGSGDNFVELSHEEQQILNITQEQNNQITIWKKLIDSSYRLWPLLDSAYHEATDSATKAQRKVALEENHMMRRNAQIAFSNFMTSYKAGNQTDWTSLITDNNAIVPTILTDTFQRRFNAIYYTTFAQEKPHLDSAQKATIRFLAHQCPLINHDVVYRSRAIMAGYEDTMTYDDYTICMESGYEHKNTREQQSRQMIKLEPLTCTLSPNPARDMVKLWFNQVPANLVVYTITDMQGRTIHTESKVMNANIHTIDVSKYGEGIYTLSVTSGDNVILNSKLQVLK